MKIKATRRKQKDGSYIVTAKIDGAEKGITGHADTLFFAKQVESMLVAALRQTAFYPHR